MSASITQLHEKVLDTLSKTTDLTATSVISPNKKFHASVVVNNKQMLYIALIEADSQGCDTEVSKKTRCTTVKIYYPVDKLPDTKAVTKLVIDTAKLWVTHS